MKKLIGYDRCPACAAHHPLAHYRTCPHVGKDPRDIPSPLNEKQDQ